MPGYFGSKTMVALQQKADERAKLIASTPGLGFSGRVMVSDDLQALGWEKVRHYLNLDGQFAFRHVDAETRDLIRAGLEPDGITIHTWDVFAAEANQIKEAITPIMATPLPEGFLLAQGDPDTLGRMQAFLVKVGIAPISVSSLSGAVFPSATRILTDARGEIVAVGWGALTQNRFSPRPQAATVGMIAVSAAVRGRGLGLRICAECLAMAIETLGAPYVMGFATRQNAPSRAMLTRCGLAISPYFMLVASVGGDKLTR